MTSRPAGRHRKGLIPQIPQTLYSPQIPWGPQRPPRPQGPLLLGYPPLFASSGGRQALRATVARERRTFAMALSATAAGVTAAVLFGTFAPLHSTWTPSGGSGAPGGGQPPQTPAPWSAAPLAIRSGQAVPPGPSPGQPLSPSPVPSLRPAPAQPWQPGERAVPPHPARHARPPRPAHPPQPARPPQHARAPQHTRPPGASQETGPDRDVHARPGAGTRKETGAGGNAKKETGAGQGPGASAAVTPGRHRRAPSLVVRYLVGREWPGGFQGEVQVINHGARPIADWQAVVALPGDTVTSVWNANGFVSHHILLLGPASATQVVPVGGTLDVLFTATGPDTIPAACAFDGTPCG